MDFVPIPSRSRDLHAWFRTRPEEFIAERSRSKTIFWAISAGVALVLCAIVWLNPETSVEVLGGRVKSGLAIAGAFALPPAVAVLCIVMLFRRSHRWRLRNGGVLKNTLILGVNATFPVAKILDALARGRENPPSVDAALKEARANIGDDSIVTVWASAADEVMYIGVLRVDGDTVWITNEPMRIGPDNYVPL